jgi:hypothetical protein
MARDAFELQTVLNREKHAKVIEEMENKMKNLQHEKDTMQTIKDEVEFELRGIISTDRRDAEFNNIKAELNELVSHLEESSQHTNQQREAIDHVMGMINIAGKKVVPKVD